MTEDTHIFTDNTGDQTIDSIAEGLYVMGREECLDPGVPEDGFLAEVG